VARRDRPNDRDQKQNEGGCQGEIAGMPSQKAFVLLPEPLELNRWGETAIERNHTLDSTGFLTTATCSTALRLDGSQLPLAVWAGRACFVMLLDNGRGSARIGSGAVEDVFSGRMKSAERSSPRPVW